MKTFFLTFAIFTIFLFTLSLVEGLFTIPVKAQTSCQQMYGGGQTCVSGGLIHVDQKVLDPKTQKMTDNLTINDTKFQPGSIINFQITITNTGQAEIKHIDVKNILPQYVIFRSGPGKFDAKTQTLAFEVENLKPNEIRGFTITGKIVDANRLPINLGIFCTIDHTIATIEIGSGQDNSQFCIQKIDQTSQKQVLAAQSQKGNITVYPAPTITTTPATGGEITPFIFLISIGIAGLLLRKIS